MRHHRIIATGAALLAVGGGVALASGSAPAAGTAATPASRLDDGKDLLPQATISEQDAIAAAQGAAQGALNEVDLEHAAGKLVYNVDVGDHDVKVDAATGDVVRSDQDD
jgi:uncharacterized membrane protein YkoI